MNRDDEAVRIRRAVLDQMLAAARAEPHLECCGLLAGRNETISAMLAAKNALRSASAYEIYPPELFSLFRQMRAERLQHLGIYHSHPRGDNAPSPADVERAFYPAAAYFIISLENVRQPVRAFRIAEGGSRELTVLAV